MTDNAETTPLLPRSSKPARTKQYFATFCCSMGALAGGTVLMFSSPAGPLLLAHNTTRHSWLPLTTAQYSWFSSIHYLGAGLGGLAGGLATNKLGRRATMLLSCVLYLAGWTLIVAAHNFGMLLSGRLLSGFAFGVSCLVIPVYTAEIASADIRGALGSAFEFSLVGGGVVCVAAAVAGCRWRLLAVVCAAPALLHLLVFLLHESPVYLLSCGDVEGAAASLQYFRGPAYDTQQELADTKQMIDDTREKVSGRDLCKPCYLKPFLVTLMLFVFMQTSGISFIISDMAIIFESAGASMDNNTNSLVVELVELAATLAGLLLVDRLGRRVLLIFSATIMALSLVVLGEYYWLLEGHEDWVQDHLGWLPLLCLLCYMVGFACGFGPVPYVMMGELLPPEVKDLLCSIITAVNWTLAFVMTLAYLPLQGAIGSDGVWLLVGGICVVGLIFCVTVVPETKGLTLHQIMAFFTRGAPPPCPARDPTIQAATLLL